MSHFKKTLDLLYHSNFSGEISKISILLVGAGGIGCEILKNLSRFDFSLIEIVISFIYEFVKYKCKILKNWRPSY